MVTGDLPKIIVNARFLTQPVTGVQRFAIELSLRLKKLLPGIKFVSPKNILQKDIAEQLGAESFGRFTSHFWEQIEFPLYLKQHHSPILLNLCNTGPLFYKKNIVCIHDLAFQVNPEWFSPTFVKLYKFVVPHIARRSLKIITVSNYSKISIIDNTGVSEEKVSVIYNGIANIFQQIERAEIPSILGDYILAVSSIDPRKNLISLIKAYKLSQISGLKLIIVGSESKVFADNNLKEEIKDCPDIKFTGYLPDNALADLYKRARMFVYPSLYEGFGIPPLEAMASGCPTIVSDAAALPEICGEASMYVNPLDITNLANKIKILNADVSLQQELREKGYKQIKKYSWEKSANELAFLLKQYL